jgi:hypothetical protein
MYGLLDVDTLDTSFIWPTLKKAGFGPNEEDLVRALRENRENKSKNIVHNALIGLWEYGTPKSVPVVKQLNRISDKLDYL